MGKTRNRSVKRAARAVVEKYFLRLDSDFDHNLNVLREVSITYSKKIRNKIAGYVTHLYKAVKRGTSKKLNIKIHEEERERKENVMPKESILDVDCVELDEVSMNMVNTYGYRGNYKLIKQ